MLTSDSSSHGFSNRSAMNDQDETAATLIELRRDLASILADVKRVVDARAAAAKDVAEVGLESARETIRTYPASSIALATLIGVAAAIVLTSGAQRPRATTRVRDWSPGITRDDLNDMVGNLQRTASRAVNGAPILSAFERVVDTVSSIDPKATLTPALEKAGAWLNTLRGNITVK
jgi:predicted transcriptional regulator